MLNKIIVALAVFSSTSQAIEMFDFTGGNYQGDINELFLKFVDEDGDGIHDGAMPWSDWSIPAQVT